MRHNNAEYEILITEISESDTPLPPVAIVQMQGVSPTAAAEVMSDLLLSLAKHNNLALEQLNANLYRTQWINGI